MSRRSGERLRIGILSMANPAWLAGQALTDVIVASMLAAHDPSREELLLVARRDAPRPPAGVGFVAVEDADLSPLGKAKRASLRARDRFPSAPGEWPLRERLGLVERSSQIQLARAAGVDVAFPVQVAESPGVDVARVGWIPDLQQRALPQMFNAQEIADRNELHTRLVAACERLVLSSHAVKDHFAEFHPEGVANVRVAPFPSQFAFQPPSGDPRAVLAGMGLPETFALIVNQFWAHKNHPVAIDALEILESRGLDVPLVLAGALFDYRDPQGRYLSELLQRVAKARLGRQVIVLGRVSFAVLVALLRCAAVVVQPSRFEGWNTTVEDALALGRPLVCSDLAVHREQARGPVGFFGCDRPDELADRLGEAWMNAAPGPDLAREATGLAAEAAVARAYGKALLEACREAAAERGSRR